MQPRLLSRSNRITHHRQFGSWLQPLQQYALHAAREWSTKEVQVARVRGPSTERVCRNVQENLLPRSTSDYASAPVRLMASALAAVCVPRCKEVEHAKRVVVRDEVLLLGQGVSKCATEVAFVKHVKLRIIASSAHGFSPCSSMRPPLQQSGARRDIVIRVRVLSLTTCK